MSHTIKDLAPSTDEQVASLRAQNKILAQQLDAVRRQMGDWQEFFAQVTLAVRAIQPFPALPRRPAKGKAPLVEAALKLSDWHIGEVVKADEVEGFNEFNSGIAEARLSRITDSFLNWIATNRSSYKIDDCTLLMEGDFVSGDIHDELLRTNEFPLPVQAARAGLLMAQIVRRIAPEFKTVRIACVGGDNHGRMTRKPQAKGRAENNMSFLVYELARTACAKLANVEWTVARGSSLLVTIGGHRFLTEHGDSIRGWAGTPYYGMARKLGKEAKRRMDNGRGFDVLSIGHFHCPAVVEGNILVNGSLSGTSEFDHLCGRHADPAQVGFMVSPKHGIFNWTPFSGKE